MENNKMSRRRRKKEFIFYIYCSFLCLPKETNQRKGSQSLDSLAANYPVLLKNIGRCETRRLWRLKQSSRLSDIFSAARLREMAFQKNKLR